jgi:hypothetical protein
VVLALTPDQVTCRRCQHAYAQWGGEP